MKKWQDVRLPMLSSYAAYSLGFDEAIVHSHQGIKVFRYESSLNYDLSSVLLQGAQLPC